MTCIIALRENSRVYIGADSLLSDSSWKGTTSEPKVFELGGFLFGVAGCMRVKQVLMAELSMPRRTKKHTFQSYTSGPLAKAIYNALTDDDLSLSESPESEIIAVSQEGVFTITADYTVIHHPEQYAAIGAGLQYALGSLFTSTGAARARINKALSAASSFCPSVRGPYTILELGGK